MASDSKKVDADIGFEECLSKIIDKRQLHYKCDRLINSHLLSLKDGCEWWEGYTTRDRGRRDQIIFGAVCENADTRLEEITYYEKVLEIGE